MGTDPRDYTNVFDLEDRGRGSEWNDNEFSFGADFDDGGAYSAQDHIDKYFSDNETAMFENFEDLIDSALD